MAEELDRRVANALVEDAQVAVPGALSAVVPGYGTTERVLDVFRSAYGGLWVGGTARLTRSEVTFAANALNRAVQTGTLDIVIPLGAIDDVEVRWGFGTRIIAIRVGRKVFKVRCYRAAAFADRIRGAAGETRGER